MLTKAAALAVAATLWAMLEAIHAQRSKLFESRPLLQDLDDPAFSGRLSLCCSVPPSANFFC